RQAAREDGLGAVADPEDDGVRRRVEDAGQVLVQQVLVGLLDLAPEGAGAVVVEVGVDDVDGEQPAVFQRFEGGPVGRAARPAAPARGRLGLTAGERTQRGGKHLAAPGKGWTPATAPVAAG